MTSRNVNMLAVGYLVVLLVLDVRLGLGIWGLVVALVGFIGIIVALDVAPRIRTRLRRQARSARVFRETAQCAEEARALLRQPGLQERLRPEVRDAFARIASRLDEIAGIIRQDPGKHRFAESFHGSYALPIRDLIRHYVTLTTRGVASARPEIERTERELLPRLERQLDELFEAIHRGDVSGLKSVNEMIELQDEGSAG